MAANKFATMLHRNTNKITLILIYAVLEWILITLLLLNSLFSYLIIKFADYFGLKPPCLWCSRVDHFLEPEKQNSHKDLLCSVHATQISSLGYCSNHQKLALHQHMCEDCSSSRPDFHGVTKNFTSFPREKKLEMIQSEGDKLVIENVEVSFKCSCCGVSLENKIYSSYDVIKPPRDVLEYTQKGNLIIEARDEDHIEEGSDLDFGFEKKCENEMIYEVNEGFGLRERETEDCSASLSLSGLKEFKGNEEKEAIKDDDSSVIIKYQISDETLPQNDDFFVHRWVSVELVDSTTEQNQRRNRVEEEQENSDHQEVNLIPDLLVEAQIGSVIERCSTEEPIFAVFGYKENEVAENSPISHGEEIPITKPVQFPYRAINDVKEIAEPEAEESALNVPPVSEEVPQIPSNETESEVSIGTEIPDLDFTIDSQLQIQDDPTTSSINFHENNHHDSKKDHEEPTSIETFNHLNKKSVLLERKESGTEESLDGSIISELEGGDGIMTVERLASALRAERKNLQALYVELEEERSASAIAANQTMAMINRLQEEKAAMQMEALQYQRMMEEQSEYDQEALQLMNDLVVRREKEKQELEKELEIYRRKVFHYEAKENMRTRSTSCDDDSDGLSVDLDQDSKEAAGDHELYTPLDTVAHLEESLGEFEEERASILEQLKVLESKLFIGDEGAQNFEGTNQHFYEENGNHKETNGFSKRIMGLKAKRLLPLFEAISEENEDGDLNGDENGFHLNTRFELEDKRVGIEEEVDQLRDRLQALEVDTEFLKHCISSLKKGDKGMDLLQEILQHLRDLRNVELQVNHLGV